ncbi:MAG: hypothetical protein HXY39_16385 [Chloroflexi bacterium]|nr:hypothetical protein [Chloroflexota bacterium]
MKSLHHIIRLHTALDLLDEGLALYRRDFAGFVLIAATWLTPLAIALGLFIGFADRLGDLLIGLLLLVGAFLALPLTVYLIGGLSRGASAAIDGRPVRLREALAIGPGRVLSAGCFTLVYSLIVQIASAALSFICICPLYVIGIAVSAILATAANGAGGGAILLALVGLLFGGVYLLALIVGGAGYGSLFYALQPWVQERLTFAQAMERSVDMVVFRFRSNLVAWALSALLVAAAGVSVSLAVGLLAPLPALLLLGAESPVAQAIASGAWLLGLVLVLPPLPIWMTLLYRRNLAARNGADLEQRVVVWAREMGIENSAAGSGD